MPTEGNECAAEALAPAEQDADSGCELTVTPSTSEKGDGGEWPESGTHAASPLPAISAEPFSPAEPSYDTTSALQTTVPAPPQLHVGGDTPAAPVRGPSRPASQPAELPSSDPPPVNPTTGALFTADLAEGKVRALFRRTFAHVGGVVPVEGFVRRLVQVGWAPGVMDGNVAAALVTGTGGLSESVSEQQFARWARQHPCMYTIFVMKCARTEPRAETLQGVLAELHAVLNTCRESTAPSTPSSLSPVSAAGTPFPFPSPQTPITPEVEGSINRMFGSTPHSPAAAVPQAQQMPPAASLVSAGDGGGGLLSTPPSSVDVFVCVAVRGRGKNNLAVRLHRRATPGDVAACVEEAVNTAVPQQQQQQQRGARTGVSPFAKAYISPFTPPTSHTAAAPSGIRVDPSTLRVYEGSAAGGWNPYVDAVRQLVAGCQLFCEGVDHGGTPARQQPQPQQQQQHTASPLTAPSPLLQGSPVSAAQSPAAAASAAAAAATSHSRALTLSGEAKVEEYTRVMQQQQRYIDELRRPPRSPSPTSAQRQHPAAHAALSPALHHAASPPSQPPAAAASAAVAMQAAAVSAAPPPLSPPPQQQQRPLRAGSGGRRALAHRETPQPPWPSGLTVCPQRTTCYARMPAAKAGGSPRMRHEGGGGDTSYVVTSFAACGQSVSFLDVAVDASDVAGFTRYTDTASLFCKGGAPDDWVLALLCFRVSATGAHHSVVFVFPKGAFHSWQEFLVGVNPAVDTAPSNPPVTYPSYVPSPAALAAMR